MARGRKMRDLRWERFSRYSNDRAIANTRYVEIARQHGYDQAQMALAYVTSRPFMTSNIIGATTMGQLRANISSAELHLSDEALEQIEAVQDDIPNPAP